jgi:hypothetical protein
MKLINPKISILINSDRTTIEFHDDASSITFLRAVLSPAQTVQALSRLSYTDCEVELIKIDRVGKVMTHKKHSFEIPKEIKHQRDVSKLISLCEATKPDGWVSDNNFSSQDTFFSKDGKDYAQTTIRQWV